MKLIGYIILIVLTFISASRSYAQTRKQSKHQLDSIFKLVTTADKATIDSIIQHIKANKETKVDTSFQVVEQTLSNGEVVEMIIIDGDTSYMYNMKSFNVVDLRPYDNKVKDKQFRRLRYHVKKVYPYAIIAANKLNYYNTELLKVKSKKRRRKLLKKREKELKEEFTDVIKKMSQTSGRVLVKLIDRETGESSYEIIKEMRGGFKAFIYQGVGKLYGADLKVKYNPKENEEDEMIERIVQMIIAGKS